MSTVCPGCAHNIGAIALLTIALVDSHDGEVCDSTGLSGCIMVKS